jgi:hypothetical protein
MKTNLDEIENSKREDDFKLISDELKRQFDLMIRVDDSHNVKLSIILGFIMVVIVQITLTTSYTNIMTFAPFAFVLFVVGFLAIICSFCLGIVAVYPRAYGFGPRVPKLIEQWKNKEEKEYAESIFGMIWKAYKKDWQIIQDKAEFIQLMLVIFSFGLVFIILSRIAPW